ncbi:diacylglycerol kinase family lipid kinase, partial [Alistipes onderdonkii]
MEAGKVKWFVIVNPVAGGGRGLDHFPQISRYLRDA